MAAKIKDGLFIGDAETSQSEVFINDNKISNLINLSGREVHNVWASHGLVYLTYYWEDRPDFKLFTNHEDPLLTDIVEFIDVSISHGISVLLFSRRGTGRCIVAACLYLMMKYRWGFEKTYDYVYSKKPDIDLNKGFIQQMFALDMKLLAARQKAQAARMGVPNTFKIEANMTINDISAMLPPIEAQRWNAWDPAYVLQSAEQADGESKGEMRGRSKSDAKITGDSTVGGVTLSGPGVGENDELILIYSFLNSKNTITMLPGPYLDVYNTHKDFKLKFNPVCYEEDVNWFPSGATAKSAVRGAMKGCRARHASQLLSTAAQPKSASAQNNSSAIAENKRIDAKTGDSNNVNSTKSTALDNIAPMYIINGQREREAAESAGNGNHASSSSINSASGGASNRDKRDSGAASYYSRPAYDYGPEGSPPSSAQSSPAHTHPHSSPSANGANHMRQASSHMQQQVDDELDQEAGYSNDLYEFVGIQSEPINNRSHRSNRDSAQRTWGPRDSIAVQRDHSLSSINTAASLPSQAGSTYSDHKRGGSDYDRSEPEQRPSSASRRNPSPQPQNAPPVAYSTRQAPTTAPSPNAASAPLSAEERLRNLMADMQRHKAGATSNTNSSRDFSDRDRGTTQGPSLYELATMQVLPSNSGGSGSASAGRRSASSQDAYGRRSTAMSEYDSMDLDEEELADPLSAFQRQGGSSGGGYGSGAVRARHDILSSTAGSRPAGGRGAAPPPPSRTAWASSGGSRGTSPVNSRPASPSNAMQAGGPSSNTYGNVPSRYASPSNAKRMSSGGATGSVSSNLSVNSVNSTGSNHIVGSGTTSSSRVYRHGSPAPNTRPIGSASGVRGSSGASGSGATAGRQHILAGSPAAGRSQPPAQSGGAGSVSSLGSGIVGSGAVGTSRTNSTGGRYASPSPSATNVRRGSNASAASLYSSESMDQGRPAPGVGSGIRSGAGRVVGSSPLRGSSATGTTGTTKRYSTPTPQSNQHHDFDSMASAGSGGSGRVRSSTPTKATWRF